MLKVTNPFDHKVIGEVALVGWDRIDAYLNEAQRLYQHQSEWLSIPERTKILKKTAGIMTVRAAELAHLIADEGGKPLIDARVEVARAIDGIELCIKELSHLSGREIPMGLTPAGAGKLAFTFREPIGPVVAVSAFNHPLNLIVHQVAPAVATGCPVLVKPADDTPLSCEVLVCPKTGAVRYPVIWQRQKSLLPIRAWPFSALSARRKLAGCCVRNWPQARDAHSNMAGPRR